MSKSLGVRKGAWTQDEDILLRNCIQKYGEGKWHQVPLKAGLNRCRKSCRLRWLNYLKPDIKRGEFSVDEVDLLIRLHKLLGNRWSLIAGRIPGRTANDVKNYWNTHMQKKMASAKEKKAKLKDHQSTTETTLIKPRARTFSRNLGQYFSKAGQNSTFSDHNIPFEKTNLSHPPPELPPPSDDVSQWWNDLFDDKEGGGGDGLWFGCSEDGQGQQPPVYQTFPAHAQQLLGEDSVHDGANAWSDFSMDMDIWHLLHSDQDLI